jgi:DNA modification methylase
MKKTKSDNSEISFASSGARRLRSKSLVDDSVDVAKFLKNLSSAPILQRLIDEGLISTSEDKGAIERLISRHTSPARTTTFPPIEGQSAGKNTYTYDAHTYHTKVPPQGIAQIIHHYLPNGGLVLDPFGGSGMTGVASEILGIDCVLNELSPAAAFISRCFTMSTNPDDYRAAVAAVMKELTELRRVLYQTTCRECGLETESRYTVWSYRVCCSECKEEFQLWDHCREYGTRVRDHKILSEFPCPSCSRILKKSRLKRTVAEPVQIGYMCCGSRQSEVTHPLNKDDLIRIAESDSGKHLVKGWFPTLPLPEGVNLAQPRVHGLDTIDKLYTRRNLSALSAIWQTIHRADDLSIASFLAFTFTSLYRRVSRLSEFRFWGGSGNTARLNVPFIFDEANVFLSFERKARTILDHLETTAQKYTATSAVRIGSATDLSTIPNDSIDLIFTDPPFGANINYSDMNFLWESWLGEFTDTKHEAIINRVQGKGVDEYKVLMRSSLQECHRVLRDGHWMIVVFMNSSASVWSALNEAIHDAGFVIVSADVFDKKHGTFKHYVSANTPGADLVLHCLKTSSLKAPDTENSVDSSQSIKNFLNQQDLSVNTTRYLHVDRADELDIRRLYSDWLANQITNGGVFADFQMFRETVLAFIEESD